MKLKVFSEKVYTKIPWIIIVMGIILRVVQYLFNRSLTEGEAALAINIVQRTYKDLLKPLDYVQAAPVGFLYLQKSLTDLLGNNEYTLRLLPLIAGIIALFIFYEVTKRTISEKAIYVSLILFTVCDHLIYFSSEIKQYSSDVAITLLIIFITLQIFEKKIDNLLILISGIVGAISVWFSHPSVFTFFGTTLILGFYMLYKKRYDKFIVLLVTCGIWLASLIFNYFISLESLSRNSDFLNFWQKSFMPLPPKSWADIRWYGYSFFRIFKNPLGLSTHELLLAILSFFVGTFALWKKDKKRYAILIVPIILVFIASGLHKYPFEGRLLLFIVPSMLLVIAAGIDFVRHITASGSKIISIFLVIILLFQPVILAGYHLFKPRAPEELRPVMVYLKDHRKEGDTIYLYYGAVNGFMYYADRFGFTKNDYAVGIESRKDWSNYYIDLNRLRENRRVWIVFSHIATWEGVDEEQLFLSYLNLLGTQYESFKVSGASTYLYDLGE